MITIEYWLESMFNFSYRNKTEKKTIGSLTVSAPSDTLFEIQDSQRDFVIVYEAQCFFRNRFHKIPKVKMPPREMLLCDTVFVSIVQCPLDAQKQNKRTMHIQVKSICIKSK